MRRTITCLFAFLLLVLASYGIGADAPAQPAADKQQAKTPQWAMNATIIEACSCPMFCQCYFDTKPAAGPDGHAGHAGHAAAAAPGGAAAPAADAAGGHYCKFNNAYKVNKGQYGDTKLDGAKFWVGGDLGAEFDDGEMDWAVLHFDPSVTKPQREGIQAALGRLYPVKWKSFTVGEDKPIEWTATRD